MCCIRGRRSLISVENIDEDEIETGCRESESGRCVDFWYLIGNRRSQLFFLQEEGSEDIEWKDLLICCGRLLPVGRSLRIVVGGTIEIFRFSIVSRFCSGIYRVY